MRILGCVKHGVLTLKCHGPAGADSKQPMIAREEPSAMLRLQISVLLRSARLRDRYADMTRHDRDRGAATLEYVVIAAAVFVAAVALVGVIIGVISREQSKIQ